MNFKYFIVYSDSAGAVSALTDEQAGALFKALFEYVNSGELPEMDNTLYALFLMFKGQIDRDAEKYEAICEARREAGKKGGRPKKQMVFLESKEKQTKAKKPNNNTNTNTNTNSKTNTSIRVNEFPQQESMSELRRQFRAQVSEYEASI